MGSMLVAEIPSKSTKNISRIPNPFPQLRLSISKAKSRLLAPINAKGFGFPKVGGLHSPMQNVKAR